jgi:hypothetical protein
MAAVNPLLRAAIDARLASAAQPCASAAAAALPSGASAVENSNESTRERSPMGGGSRPAAAFSRGFQRASSAPLSTAEEYWSAWRSEIGAAGVRPLELGDRY